MEGAESFEVMTGFFESHPLADDIRNVYPGFYLIDVAHPGSRTSDKTQSEEVVFQSALEKPPSLIGF
jgi:hypothetical protein